MTSGIIAFALGICWLQYQPALPAPVLLQGLGGVGVLLLILRRRWGQCWLQVPAMLLLGIAWAGLLAHQRLADHLPETSEGQDIQVVGTVAAMPQRFENGWRFLFDIESAAMPVPERVSLAWYQSRQLDEEGLLVPVQTLHAGERWLFTVRLKRPHGNANPHGFDYEAWLLAQNIRATGYVRAKAGFQRLQDFVPTPGHRIERLRESLRQRFENILGDSPATGILVALAVGDQQGIAPEQWQVFSRTGLTHLFSVSGLHVTLIAGLCAAAVGWFWRRQPWLTLRIPAQQAALVAGMVTALAYCLLAGFAVPAQRTLYMLWAVGLALLVRRSLASHQVLALALAVVLLLDPWAVLAAGFWLSFGAVAMLFYIGSARVSRGRDWRHGLASWGRAQWAMTVGMVPLMLALFQQFSLVSPLANGVAIPLVSFIITPLALLATVPGLGFLLPPAAALTEWLVVGASWLAHSPWAVWQQGAPAWPALLLGLSGSLLLLAPRGIPARWLGVVLCLPLFFPPNQRPAVGEARALVLDVGQGLAVHVQTANHDLLFDTGPQFSPDANSGNRIIVPYLRAENVRQLDTLIVSHADKDHSGGALSVLDGLPVGALHHALPDGHEVLAQFPAASPCYDGQSWTWDGVTFSLLHPRLERHAAPTRKTNDMSCVLKVVAAGRSLLIPSDIEALSEQALLLRHADDLASNVLVAPHHGSRTSSTEAFVAAVGARDVIFPVGYRNRFGHPKEDVVARYASATLHRTDQQGAVQVDLSGESVRIAHQREQAPRYWFGR